MEATRPRQIVYLTYLASPVKEGSAYMFFAMDDYSEAVLSLGIELDNSEATVLKAVKKLMVHKDFKTSPKKPFTLVTSLGQEFKDKMKAIIRPYKGKLILDPETTLNRTKGFAEFLANKN